MALDYDIIKLKIEKGEIIMIFKDKKDADISYTDLKELASDISFAQDIKAHVEMSKQDFRMFEKAIEDKKKELLYYIDRACIAHEGAGQFYPYGYAVLVDSLEEDNNRIKKLDINEAPIYYDLETPYHLSTNFEREVGAWWVLKEAVFAYGVKHGYLQFGPRERENKDILREIKANFAAIKDDRVKIVGRDFSEEELDDYLKDTRNMSR